MELHCLCILKLGQVGGREVSDRFHEGLKDTQIGHLAVGKGSTEVLISVQRECDDLLFCLKRLLLEVTHFLRFFSQHALVCGHLDHAVDPGGGDDKGDEHDE